MCEVKTPLLPACKWLWEIGSMQSRVVFHCHYHRPSLRLSSQNRIDRFLKWANFECYG